MDKPHFWKKANGKECYYLCRMSDASFTDYETDEKDWPVLDEEKEYEIWTYPLNGSYDNGYIHKIMVA